MALAFLQICIDIQVYPPVVSRVEIMSDGNPTTQLSRETWVTLMNAEGSTYESAHNRLYRTLQRSPIMFGWMNPFFGGELFPDMPLPESPDLTENWAPVDIGHRGEAFEEPESQRAPGLPAFQRLGDFILGEDD